jgi:hypothetical protein
MKESYHAFDEDDAFDEDEAFSLREDHVIGIDGEHCIFKHRLDNL